MPMSDAEAAGFIDQAAQDLLNRARNARDWRAESLYRGWNTHISSIGKVLDRARELITNAGRQLDIPDFNAYVNRTMHEGNYLA